jgi:hypothetical protein
LSSWRKHEKPVVFQSWKCPGCLDGYLVEDNVLDIYTPYLKSSVFAIVKLDHTSFQEREPMTQVQFEKVVEEVKALSPAEQRKLRTLLDTFLAPADATMTEDEFARKLAKFGVLSEVKPPITDLAPYQKRQPVETTGKPLSEVILEERR